MFYLVLIVYSYYGRLEGIVLLVISRNFKSNASTCEYEHTNMVVSNIYTNRCLNETGPKDW